MRKKSNLLLLVLMVLAVFLLNGCGENAGENAAEKEATPVVQVEPVPAALTASEQKNMDNILTWFFMGIKSYIVHNDRFPATKAEVEEDPDVMKIEGYEVQYEVTEKNGKVEEFVITVFNPAKTHKVAFESACYKLSNCVEAYQFTSVKKLLKDSQIKSVEQRKE